VAEPEGTQPPELVVTGGGRDHGRARPPGQLDRGFWAELCTWGAIVPDYEFEPYELRDPRPNAPEADDFWGGEKWKWPIILPTKRTRLSKVLKMLKENDLSYDTLHCFHCRVSVETMKSWHTTASIVG